MNSFNASRQAQQQGFQSLGILAIISWSFICGFILFYALHKTAGICVEARVEEEGLDIYEHGETAYNN